MRYHGSDIDGPSFNPDALNVRGRDLNDLIRGTTYVDAIWHLFTGRMPAREEGAGLDAFLRGVPAAFPPDHDAITVARLTARSGVSVSRAMSAGLMIDSTPILREAARELPGVDDATRDAITNFAVPPLLLSAVLFPDDDPAAPFRDAADYLGAMYGAVARHDFASPGARRAFDAALVALHAGFGVVTPTVQAPRISIGTGAPLPHAFAAGYATAGPNHAGACEEAMKLIRQVVQRAAGDTIRERAASVVASELAARRLLYGFGHPLFETDPRPPVLRALTIEYGLDSPYLEAYDAIAAAVAAALGVKPNIDSIVGAICLSLSMAPAAGTGLFLCSRTAAMAAHAIERRATKPAFGAARGVAREFLKSTSKDDFALTNY
jgi:citrate synthase